MSRITHGRSTINGKRTSEYLAWKSLKARCYNKNNNRYKNYGERGIQVCERWINNFENFLNDMGTKPSEYHSIDRIDVNGNYEPINCKWSTRSEQETNKQLSKRNKSGFQGVHWRKEKSKWEAHISANKKRIHLGYYDDINLAIESRKEADLKYFGKKSS